MPLLWVTASATSIESNETKRAARLACMVATINNALAGDVMRRTASADKEMEHGTGVMPYPAAYCSPSCHEHHDTRSGDDVGLSASPMS